MISPNSFDYDDESSSNINNNYNNKIILSSPLHDVDEPDISSKIFIGQIPKDMDEDMLLPIFESFILDPIVELKVIRDRINLSHKGCVFISFANYESSLRAIGQIHDKIILPNARGPLQAKLAESKYLSLFILFKFKTFFNYIYSFLLLLGQSERENKLFIGMIPKKVDEEGLEVIFSSYGDLREVHIIRGPDGSSKGCAFVKFEDRNAALVAIEDLHESVPMGSNRPLVVKFADTKKSNTSEDSNITQSGNGGNINHQQGHSNIFQGNQFKDYDSYGSNNQFKAPVVHGLQNKSQKLQYPPSQQHSSDYDADSSNLYGNSNYLQQSSMLYKDNEVKLDTSSTRLKPQAAQFNPRNQIPQNISYLPEDLPEDSRLFQQQQQLYDNDVYLPNNSDRYGRQAQQLQHGV
jgi:RNA recognition motif-containing protein